MSTIQKKYQVAFNALTNIAAGGLDAQSVARAAMQECVDLGDSSETTARSRERERLLRENVRLREGVETALRRLKHIDPVWAVGAATSVLESALKF
jgi:hypothetical protein